MRQELEVWVRSQHTIHKRLSKDAGPGPIRAYHDGAVAATLVLLGDGSAASQLASIILSSGTRSTRGMAGMRDQLSQAEGVKSYLSMLDEKAADSWTTPDVGSDMQDVPAGVGG